MRPEDTTVSHVVARSRREASAGVRSSRRDVLIQPFRCSADGAVPEEGKALDPKRVVSVGMLRGGAGAGAAGAGGKSRGGAFPPGRFYEALDIEQQLQSHSALQVL